MNEDHKSGHYTVFAIDIASGVPTEIEPYRRYN